MPSLSNYETVLCQEFALEIALQTEFSANSPATITALASLLQEKRKFSSIRFFLAETTDIISDFSQNSEQKTTLDQKSKILEMQMKGAPYTLKSIIGSNSFVLYKKNRALGSVKNLYVKIEGKTKEKEITIFVTTETMTDNTSWLKKILGLKENIPEKEALDIIAPLICLIQTRKNTNPENESSC